MAFSPRFILCWLALSVAGSAAISPVPVSESASAHPSGDRTAIDQTTKPEKIPAALARAVALASLVEDEEFQARIKKELVDFHLTNDWPESALKIAGSIPDYRRGIAIARVAANEARRGKTDRLESLLDAATNHSGFPHPWQGEAIRAEAAVAWAAAGQEERGAELAAKLLDPGAQLRVRSGLAVERARRGESYDSTTFDAPKDVLKLTPELLILARGAIEIAQARLASGKDDKETAATLCEQSEAIVRACKATAGEELLDLGILWRQIGNLKKSTELLGLALHHLPPGVELQGWRAGYFARLVGLYVEAGNQEQVTKLLETGRQGIAPLHAFHQPPAFCQLAEAELTAGLAGKAEATWVEALAVALRNPNPSSRSLGAAQVTFSIARTGRSLSEKVITLLDTLTPSHAEPEAASAEK